jgi:Cas6b C-terminal domain/Cas6b N-terminal domain
MDISLTEYRLRFERPLSPGEATHLRGYFGSAFAEEELLHHRRPDGTLIYAYPRVRFVVLDRTAHLIGLADGGDLVERLWREVETVRLRDEVLPVLDATLLRRQEPLGDCAEPVEYRFVNPWLGLNSANHARYRSARTDAERWAVLERVLVGNCLSLSKSFGVWVTGRLAADARRLRPRQVNFKGQPMVAFEGPFRVNFRLPNWIGLGKSVSRGFGTVEAAERKGVATC